MDVYKGIVKFDGFYGSNGEEPVSFLGWVELVLGRTAKEFPETHAILSSTAKEREAKILREHKDQDARNSAWLDLQQQDKNAKADVLLFLGSTLQRRYVRFPTGSKIWDDLHLSHENFVRTRGPVLWAQLQNLAPRENERLAAYGQRVELLQCELAEVGRQQTDKTMLDAMFKGWIQEHPEWTVIIQSTRAVMTGCETVASMTQTLVEQEVNQADTLATVSSTQRAAVFTSSAVPGVEQRITAIESAVQQIAAAVAKMGSAGPVVHAPGTKAVVKPARRCYRCNSPHHGYRDCPEPFAGQGALHASGVTSHVSWMLDSGCTHDMHPGGGQGASAFARYRRFEQPLTVYFGKQGVTSAAVGVGEMTLTGTEGPVVLPDVLHVPDLACPLLSVKAALRRGLSVHFWPSEGPGGSERIALMHGDRVMLTARPKGDLFFIQEELRACTAAVSASQLSEAWDCHRKLGHVGFTTLAKMCQRGFLRHTSLTPSALLQARKQGTCEPCVVGKLRRTSHPPRQPREVRVLERVHMDLCDLPIGYFGTVIDEATRYASVLLLQRKSDTAAAVRDALKWCETQTGKQVQRVRHDRGGEYMVGTLQSFYAERGIQMEPTAGYSPEANGLAERHNLRLLDMALPMLADSGDARHNLAPLGERYAADAIIYANDLHNAMPAAVSGSRVGRTPHEAFLGREVTLGVFRRFGCRVWAHVPGKPFAQRPKFGPRGVPGRFLGFERPFGSGIYRVLLDNGGVTQTQTVEFDTAPTVPPPVLLPAVQIPGQQCPQTARGEDSDSDDEESVRHGCGESAQVPVVGQLPSGEHGSGSITATPPATRLPTGSRTAHQAVDVRSGSVSSGETQAVGRPVRTTRNPNPRYAFTLRCSTQLPGNSTRRGFQGDRGVGMIGGIRGEDRSSELGNVEDGRGDRGLGCPERTCGKSKTRAARVAARRRHRRAQRNGERGSQGQREPGKGRSKAGRGRRRKLTVKNDTSVKCQDGGVTPEISASTVQLWESVGALAVMTVVADPVSYPLPPSSVSEALSRTDAAHWQAAIDDEVQACLGFGVWEQCVLPTGKRALPSRFVLERKRDGRYKARLVAGGHRQEQGVDYEETFAPVCSYRTLRMILAVSAHAGLALRQFDICTAFLNGELAEEVYLQAPKGAEGLADQGKVLRLRRALYGLRQASRSWNRCLEAALLNKGFVQSDADPALWILLGGAGVVLAMFYVDDGLVAARTPEEADALVELVGTMFQIRKLGEPTDFLGIEIRRDWDAGTITICQETKAVALATGLGLGGEQDVILPMSPEVYGELRAAKDSDAMADKAAYQRTLGSLLHLAQCTRPDIALPVAALAAYASKPSVQHWEALLGLVKYVGVTATRGITYGTEEQPVGFWCDANYASCRDTRRSTTGWVVTMYGGAVSWSSKKQPTVAASTMDAEYQACGAAAREGLSLRKAFGELALLSNGLELVGPLQIGCDNKAAISLCKDRKEGERVKHIDIIHHFARDHVRSGELLFVYCKSENNVSDCLTKALARPLFEKGLKGMGML